MDLDLILAVTGKSLVASEQESVHRHVQAPNVALTHHILQALTITHTQV